LDERGVDPLQQLGLVGGGVLGQVLDALAEQADLAVGGGVAHLGVVEHLPVGLRTVGQLDRAALEEVDADLVVHGGGGRVRGAAGGVGLLGPGVAGLLGVLGGALLGGGRGHG